METSLRNNTITFRPDAPRPVEVRLTDAQGAPITDMAVELRIQVEGTTITVPGVIDPATAIHAFDLDGYGLLPDISGSPMPSKSALFINDRLGWIWACDLTLVVSGGF